MTDQWTPRMQARTELARTLKDKHLGRATGAGLVAADLEGLVSHGDAAHEADRAQKAELTELFVARGERSATAEGFFTREDALRDRLPAVVGDLGQAGQRELAGWLARLSFARYRVRDLAPSADATGGESDAEVVRVTRVEREDIATRLEKLGAFCTALAAPGREAIVAAFAARGLDAAAIASLGADADALAKLGRNKVRAASATALEAEHAKAHRDIWQRVRRMVRKAVAGDVALVAAFADC
ncbi:MAG: hypothetical protein HY908_33600 [Myxococcales bacterium]|nr:hypothetical protein [Myxococcales bacterium]